MSGCCSKNREKLIEFIQNELINTAEVMQILNCSQQNISDLIKRGDLVPVKEMPKDRLFFKTDVLERNPFYIELRNMLDEIISVSDIPNVKL
ncbi:helix-turn-helix domain-containing protein [Acetonema longum]|uniref:Helix-turn-helix domain-containing protein n=1 Tax=Acetonema longum DSM 6540 TaxID=1009370 RepID=F7NDU6_9FIRM|nr:helix-turn-helix domain-containing protein [Acetonema longum]EGO65761.1 hypothetical protein ALO_01015 [Acetonema longum DSM 6540]